MEEGRSRDQVGCVGWSALAISLGAHMAKPPSGSLWQGAACHEGLKVRLPSSANHPSLWSHRGMKPPVARPLTMPPSCPHHPANSTRETMVDGIGQDSALQVASEHQLFCLRRSGLGLLTPSYRPTGHGSGLGSPLSQCPACPTTCWRASVIHL